MIAREAFDVSGIRAVLSPTGKLLPDTAPDVTASYLRAGFESLNGCGLLEASTLRELFVAAGVKASQADAALREQQGPTDQVRRAGSALDLCDPDPWLDTVDGAELLESLSGWLRRYVWMPAEACDAVAAWIVATWFVSDLYFAPLLLLLSATKRCGKTLLLDLLQHVVRRGHLTAGSGITAPVLFRLNETVRPTFLIDEGERLGGRGADQTIVQLLNSGHRRGAKVDRCVGDENEIRTFDAFGYRAIAAVGSLWDTLIDRGIVIRLERKAKNVQIARFNGRVVAREGLEIARRLRRWTDDHRKACEAAEEDAIRPEWLDDRACNSWAPLFAVASLAGGDWPGRIEKAARTLASQEEDIYQGEELLRDVRRIFEDANQPEEHRIFGETEQPEALKSGELVARLKTLDSAPWADLREGKGISTHKLAAMLKPFGVRSRHGRPAGAEKDLRGYWLEDLQPVFDRYVPPPRVSQVSQSSPGAGSRGFQSVTKTDSCDTSESHESPVSARVVTLVTLPEPPLEGMEGQYEADERFGMQLEE